MPRFDTLRISSEATSVEEITIPLKLMDRTQYPNLSMVAVLVYSYLCALPKQIDDEGREYVVFPLSTATELFGGCAKSTITTSISRLKEAGLLEIRQIGFGEARRYYVTKEETKFESQH